MRTAFTARQLKKRISTTKYYLYNGGYGETGCFIERIVSVTILPYPTPVISYSPCYVDVNDPTLALRDESLNSTTSLWTFSNGSTSNAHSLNHRFNDVNSCEDNVFL